MEQMPSYSQSSDNFLQGSDSSLWEPSNVSANQQSSEEQMQSSSWEPSDVSANQQNSEEQMQRLSLNSDSVESVEKGSALSNVMHHRVVTNSNISSSVEHSYDDDVSVLQVGLCCRHKQYDFRIRLTLPHFLFVLHTVFHLIYQQSQDISRSECDPLNNISRTLCKYIWNLMKFKDIKATLNVVLHLINVSLVCHGHADRLEIEV